MELLTWPSIEERLGEIEYQKRDRIYEVKGSMALKDYLDCIINGAMETMGGEEVCR